MEEEKVENKDIKNATIETYADDMAKVIGDNENGIVKRMIEEEEKHNAEEKKVSPETKKNEVFLILGIFLFVAAFVAVILVFVFREKIFTVDVKPQYVPIIFTDKTEFKEISGLKKDEVIQTIVNESNTSKFKDGGVEAIYVSINQKVLGFRQFLNIIEANLDQTKIEFINDNFLVGVVDEKSSISNQPSSLSGRDFFILLKMRSILDIFDTMHLWESKMFFDLHKFFGVELNIDTKYLLEKDFEDGIIQNKNARILKDKDGKIIMMYIYAEEDSFIITNSEIAVKEIMLRLASSKVKK